MRFFLLHCKKCGERYKVELLAPWSCPKDASHPSIVVKGPFDEKGERIET